MAPSCRRGTIGASPGRDIEDDSHPDGGAYVVRGILWMALSEGSVKT